MIIGSNCCARATAVSTPHAARLPRRRYELVVTATRRYDGGGRPQTGLAP